MRFFICDPPRKKKSAPEDGTPACTLHILQSCQQAVETILRG